MTTNEPQVPGTFYEEFRELAGDLPQDLEHTFTDLDPEVGKVVRLTILEIFKRADAEPDEAKSMEMLFRDLSSLVLWTFMLGREHAARGYPPPVGKSDTNDDVFPDDIRDL